MPVSKTPIQQRFWAKVQKLGDADCWEWLAYICRSTGYGRFGIGYPKTTSAHRYSFELANGPIGPGVVVRHSCDNRKCVNPHHLIAGTHADNMADMVDRGRSSTGEGSGVNKLTEQQVVSIRESYAAGDSSAKLGVEFDITRQQIAAIARGQFWKHVAGPLTRRRK